MTARDALAQAVAAPRGERLHLFETVCVPRGACRREPLTNEPGRWTWCPDCVTVSDDYGVAVNPEKAEEITYQKADQIIVLAED